MFARISMNSRGLLIFDKIEPWLMLRISPAHTKMSATASICHSRPVFRKSLLQNKKCQIQGGAVSSLMFSMCTML